VYSASWCTSGMGINGTINVPIWTSASNIYWGNFALIDENGRLVFLRSYSGLSKTQRDAAPANFRFLEFGTDERDTTVTSSTYTIGSKYRYVDYGSSGGIITMPTVTTSVGRVITIRNTSAGAITVSNVASGDVTSIPAGKLMTYRNASGVSWKSIINQEGTGGGGGGSSQWTTSGSYIYYNNNIAVGSTAPNQYALIQTGPSTSAKALFEFSTSSVDVATPRNGNLWYNATDLKWHSSGVTQTLATNFNTMTFLNKFWQGYPIDIQYWSPEGGSARQIARVNSAETEMEFADPNYELLYSNNADIDFQNTTSATSLMSGSGTITPVDAPNGSKYVFKASGYVSTTTTTQNFTFVINTGGGSRSLVRTLPANLSSAAYTLEYTESFSGAGYRYSFFMHIDNNGTPYVLALNASAASGWSMVSNKSVTFAWSSASVSNRFRVFNGSWEVFRRQ
jgi:hypothetical protein